MSVEREPEVRKKTWRVPFSLPAEMMSRYKDVELSAVVEVTYHDGRFAWLRLAYGPEMDGWVGAFDPGRGLVFPTAAALSLRDVLNQIESELP